MSGENELTIEQYAEKYKIDLTNQIKEIIIKILDFEVLGKDKSYDPLKYFQISKWTALCRVKRREVIWEEIFQKVQRYQKQYVFS